MRWEVGVLWLLVAAVTLSGLWVLLESRATSHSSDGQTAETRMAANREAVLAALRGLPGGQQALDDVLRLTDGQVPKPEPSPPSFLTRLNPFKVAETEAMIRGSYTFGPFPTWLTLTPANPVGQMATDYYLSGTSVNGSLRFVGVGILAPPYNVAMFDQTVAFGKKPRVWFEVFVPRDGWYVVNFTMTGQTLATLYHAVMPPSVIVLGGQAAQAPQPPQPLSISLVQTWDYRSRPVASYVYPALVELKAGTHDFFWELEAGAASMEEADLIPLAMYP